MDADGAEPRFPHAAARLVRERLKVELAATRADWLVSSAACGADLLVGLEASTTIRHLRAQVWGYARSAARSAYRSGLCGWAAVLLTVLPGPAFAQEIGEDPTAPPADPTLLDRLRLGGFVIYFRHATIDFSMPTPTW
jgi:hypothetical protein